MAKLLIANFGPNAVKLEMQGRDAQGQYIEKAEVIIAPSSSRTVTVNSPSSLQIIELADDPEHSA